MTTDNSYRGYTITYNARRTRRPWRVELPEGKRADRKTLEACHSLLDYLLDDDPPKGRGGIRAGAGTAGGAKPGAGRKDHYVVFAKWGDQTFAIPIKRKTEIDTIQRFAAQVGIEIVNVEHVTKSK